MTRYLWPALVGIVFQFVFNAVASFYLGKFDSRIGDWIYGRDCGGGFCDGAVFVVGVWTVLLVVAIINAIVHRRRNAA